MIRIASRSRWAACGAGLLLAAYVAFVGFAVWQSNNRHDPAGPIASDLAPMLTALDVPADDADIRHKLEALILNATEFPTSGTPTNSSEIRVGDAIDNPAKAAWLAASFANAACRRLWRREPFHPHSYSAHLENGRWHWGAYDPGGYDGFSAEVSFGPDGTASHVQINFSIDTLDDRHPGARVPRP